MKAVIWTKYGSPDVLKIKEITKPHPKDNEILIKVHASTVTAAECPMRKGKPYFGRIILGLIKPKYQIPGLELAGEIEYIGKKVKRFKVGDQVCGFTGFRLGAHAEYTCMPENASMILKPSGFNYQEAASLIDGATTALFFLQKKAGIHCGQKILIIGASGSIGSAAVQIARSFGAEVTGICSGLNTDLVKSLGANHVIDYSKEDFTQSGRTYDIIFDTVNKSTFAECKKILKPKGIYMPTNIKATVLLQVLWSKLTGKKRLKFGLSVNKNEALLIIKELCETGKLKPVIDRCYSIMQIAEAHQYVEMGHKKGNVVITIIQEHDF